MRFERAVPTRRYQYAASRVGTARANRIARYRPEHRAPLPTLRDLLLYE